MFLDEWKKIGKFHTRRFQQVKIFSLQILFLVVFANPNLLLKTVFYLFLFFCSMVFILLFNSL